MTTTENTSRTRVLTLDQAMDALDEMAYEFERFYSTAINDPERRKRLARWLVAAGMGRQALAATKQDEERRDARAAAQAKAINGGSDR